MTSRQESAWIGAENTCGAWPKLRLQLVFSFTKESLSHLVPRVYITLLADWLHVECSTMLVSQTGLQGH